MSNKAQYKYTLNLGSGTGTFILSYDASNPSNVASVPVRFTVDWNGNTITSGFVGDHLHDIQLAALGFPSVNASPKDYYNN